MALFFKWLVGSGLLGAGTLASIWAVVNAAAAGSSSSGGGGGSYAQVPELSLGSAGLAAVLLAGTAVLLAEQRRKAVRA